MIDRVSMIITKIILAIITSKRNAFCFSTYIAFDYIFSFFSHIKIENPYYFDIFYNVMPKQLSSIALSRCRTLKEFIPNRKSFNIYQFNLSQGNIIETKYHK